MREFKQNTESGIKPDIVLPNGTRLRSLPWGGRQCRGMGIRTWRGGFEIVDLHPGTLEPFESENPDRFRDLADAAAWAVYQTERVAAFLLDRPEPEEPAVKPIDLPATPVIHKRTNTQSRVVLRFS